MRSFSTVPYPYIEGVHGQDKIEYLRGGAMIVRLCTLTPYTKEGVELCYTFFFILIDQKFVCGNHGD